MVMLAFMRNFSENGKYKIVGIGEGGDLSIGSFYVEKNVLNLIPSGPVPELLQSKLIKLVLKSTETSLRYKYYFYDVGNKRILFWNLNSVVPNGTIRIFNGQKVVIERGKAIINNDRVFIRDSPSQGGGKYLFLLSDNRSSDQGYTFFLPLNHEVNLVCRTAEKNKIGKWEDYWYYVDSVLPGYSRMKLENTQNEHDNWSVWIYGAFLTKKN